ncbi:MAG: PQQ-dependent sugar dehydrogenase [Bdellovibrionales bacterium]|nr:PQQ-dependent sugar dehydrogenase [Bdellovibrionales bacterium]
MLSSHLGKMKSLSTIFVVLLVAVLAQAGCNEKDVIPEVSEVWNAEEGFELSRDLGEFTAPVTIAQRPLKEEGADAVQFLITELRGTIKSVSNDGTIKELYKLEVVGPKEKKKDLPGMEGEIGLTGICFSPDEKYLFATGVRQTDGQMHNAVIRFKSVGKRPWTKIEPDLEWNKNFQDDYVNVSHIIGNCFVDEKNHFYVGVGDGLRWQPTHDISVTNGKVLRTTLDFKGVPDNPFYKKDQPTATESMVYASGLRNPFAITKVGEHVLVADNGPSIDRLLKLEPGTDYPWTGKDDSMTHSNLKTITPSIGPSGIVYVPEDHPIKKLRKHLVIMSSHKAGVYAVPFDKESGEIAGDGFFPVTRFGQQWRHDFSGVALFPDRLLISHIRIRHKHGLMQSHLLSLKHSDRIGTQAAIDGKVLFNRQACKGCHMINGKGGQQGPQLDTLASRLKERLSDKEYLAALQKAHDFDGKELILDESQSDAKRMEMWIQAKIKNPKFDNPTSSMPKLPINDRDIGVLSQYIMKVNSLPMKAQRFFKKNKKTIKPVLILLALTILASFGRILIRRYRRSS